MTKKESKDSKKVKRSYKAGTTVRLNFICNFVGANGWEDVVLDFDYSEDELNAFAYEWALEQIQPEGWVTVGKEK